LEEVAQAATL